MKTIQVKYGQRVNYIFALTLVIGIAFSSIVYFRGSSVSTMTSNLITEKIPNYELISSLATNMTEQERILYEYYADDDPERIKEFQDMVLNIDNLLNQLFDKFGQIEPLTKTQTAADNIAEVGKRFSATIQTPNSNQKWVTARAQLKEISSIRREALPQIERLSIITGDSVAESESGILYDLESVRLFVVCYSILSLIIAYVVARAFKAYMLSSIKSRRLSLFPMRNPNPIISVDKKNNVTFANPAAEKLLNQLGYNLSQAGELLASELKKHQKMVLSTADVISTSFQYKIKELEFQCELHWLEDQKQWDMHLIDITDRKKAERELNFLAYHNPETELKNQYQLSKDIEKLFEKKMSFTVGIIDIRSYSQLISGRGLDTALNITKEISVLLSHLSATICEHKRFSAYHIGEKSFVLLSPFHLKDDGIYELIRLITNELSKTTFSEQSQIELDYGFCFAPEHGFTYTEILRNARTTLDHSARSDDLHNVIYNHEVGTRLALEQRMTSDMRDALENGDFELHLQPQLSLENRNIVGAEVLIRWNNNGTWVSPGEFIPLAESSGFIIKLGDWILRTACKKALKLVEAGYDDLVLAVNISPKQFGRPDFLQKVSDTLKETGLPAKNLELEITEGVIIYNEEETIETLSSLKKLGVMLSIDDFGTGYSSLSYLKKFDIDKLKIDQSFVRHIQTEKADESIVRTIIDLGRNLDLKLIAEGVEEAEQLEILKSMGCDEIQGYFFSRPLPEQDFQNFIQEHKS